VLLSLASAWLRPLSEPDEARYGETAREMLLSQDFLLPQSSGVLYPDKPAGIYWAMATSMAIFGVSPLAIRIPAFLSFLLVLLLLWRYLTLLKCNPYQRWITLLMLASNLLLWALGQLATIDMVLCGLVCGSLIYGRQWLDDGRLKHGLFCGIFLGFSILCKGPIGVLLSFLILFSYGLITSRRLKVLRLLHPSLLIPTFAIGFSWFYLAAQEVPQLWDFWIGREIVERATSNTHARAQAWWFFPALTLLSTLPWVFGLLLPKTPHKLDARYSRDSNDLRFFGLWALLPLIFFSIPVGKQPAYMAPAMPGLALLLGTYWSLPSREKQLKFLTSSWTGLIAGAFLLHLDPDFTRGSERIVEQLRANHAQNWPAAQRAGWSYGLNFQLGRTDIQAFRDTPSTWRFNQEYLNNPIHLSKSDRQFVDSCALLNSKQPSFLILHNRSKDQRSQQIAKLRKLCDQPIYEGVSTKYSCLISNRKLQQ